MKNIEQVSDETAQEKDNERTVTIPLEEITENMK